jgi:hypothetical protein
VRSARGVWILVALAGVVAVVVANVALLGLATERNDPVGRLQPVAALDVTTPTGTVPGPAPVTTTDDDKGDGHGGSSGGERDD